MELFHADSVAMRIAIAFVLFMTACARPVVNSTNTAVLVNEAGTPAIAVANRERSVTIESRDGVRLVGSLLASPKPNSPAALLLHQWESDRHSYDEFANRLHAKGFTVLAIDGRGFGESTQKADGSVVTAGRTDADVVAMLGDVGAAIDFLMKQNNVDATK